MSAKKKVMWLWEEKGLSIAEIARRAGLARNTIADVRSGRTVIGSKRVREAIDSVYRDVKGESA